MLLLREDDSQVFRRLFIPAISACVRPMSPVVSEAMYVSADTPHAGMVLKFLPWILISVF